ncbi:MAG: Amino acid permease, partial [Bryobacterales bacterium]|nr:Amino acid permease [Bryobacterales bacterium]
MSGRDRNSVQRTQSIRLSDIVTETDPAGQTGNPAVRVEDTSIRGRVRSIANLLFGKPLSSDEESHQRVGWATGIPIFGLDALGSAAYGPEATLTVLVPLGALAPETALPITVTIAALLIVVYLSYRQTIQAYPSGGGSYTVARQNLGASAGLLAGAALMLDYLMNVAVGIATGVGALVSALPQLQPHTLAICLSVLAILTIVNVRGARETGVAFMVPTYAFVACMLITIGVGLLKSLGAGGHPAPVVNPPQLTNATSAATFWILLRAFAGGCTAMTGVEAVSNGVRAFREPATKTAQRTLTIIIGILLVLLAGIEYVSRVYHIGATEPGRSGYQSVLSQLIAAVAGKGVFYYVAMGSILVALSLSANTSFADFPRLCRAMAQHGFLPYEFATRGRRLVYSYGVYVLAFLSAILLVMFGGITDRLIPLFAIGAFLSFTMPQAGMVVHWMRKKDIPGRTRMMLLNGVGAAATGATLIIIAAAKFLEGAWMVLVVIPLLISLIVAIRHHYHRVALEISSPAPIDASDLRTPIVIVPIDEWNNVTKKALRFALTLSNDVRALHVSSDEESGILETQWGEWAAEPAERVGKRAPR